MEANAASQTTTSENNITLEGETSINLNPCPHCGGLYKGTHGVAIHISRAHPVQHRESILSRQSNWKHKKVHVSSSSNEPNHVIDNGVSSDTLKNSTSSPQDSGLLEYKNEMLKRSSEFQNIDTDDSFCTKVQDF